MHLALNYHQRCNSISNLRDWMKYRCSRDIYLVGEYLNHSSDLKESLQIVDLQHGHYQEQRGSEDRPGHDAKVDTFADLLVSNVTDMHVLLLVSDGHHLAGQGVDVLLQNGLLDDVVAAFFRIVVVAEILDHRKVKHQHLRSQRRAFVVKAEHVTSIIVDGERVAATGLRLRLKEYAIIGVRNAHGNVLKAALHHLKANRDLVLLRCTIVEANRLVGINCNHESPSSWKPD